MPDSNSSSVDPTTIAVMVVPIAVNVLFFLYRYTRVRTTLIFVQRNQRQLSSPLAKSNILREEIWLFLIQPNFLPNLARMRGYGNWMMKSNALNTRFIATYFVSQAMAISFACIVNVLLNLILSLVLSVSFGSSQKHKKEGPEGGTRGYSERSRS